MPRRRLLPTLLIYDCSQLLFLVLQLWRGRTYTAGDFILSMLSWNSFGNDNWYIFVILGLYTITWLVLRGRELDPVTVGRVSVASLAFMLALLCAGKGAHWYNTLLCYPMGMWFFLYKDKIDRFLSRSSRYWPTAIVVVSMFLLAHRCWNRSLFFYVLTMLLFALCVVLFTMKVQLKSPVLTYCGKHLQGLFLVHRLPFIILGDILPWRGGPGVYLYFSLGVAGAFLLEFIFSKAISFLKNSTPVAARA